MTTQQTYNAIRYIAVVTNLRDAKLIAEAFIFLAQKDGAPFNEQYFKREINKHRDSEKHLIIAWN